MQTQQIIKPTKKSILNDKKKLIPIIILAVLGIVLLIVGSNIGKSGSSTAGMGGDGASVDEYIAEQEKKIASLCEKVNGVYNVSVALSVESGYENIYACDSDEKIGDSISEYEYKHIILGSGNSENMVIVSQNPPKISGIAIVCHGGGNPETQRNLILLISTAYNIGSNKIYIAEAKNQ